MKPITRVALSLLASVAGLAIVAAIFIYSGASNIAATTGHTKSIEQVFRTLMMRSVAAHARHITPPPNFDSKDRALAERAVRHMKRCAAPATALLARSLIPGSSIRPRPISLMRYA